MTSTDPDTPAPALDALAAPNPPPFDDSPAPVDAPLRVALDRLVAYGTITPDQARAVETEVASTTHAGAPASRSGAAPAPAPAHRADASSLPEVRGPAGAPGPAGRRPTWSTVVAEVGAYIGAVFVLAAAATFTGSHWGDLSHIWRMVVLGVPAVLMLAAAVVVARTSPGGWSVHERRGTAARRRLVAALVLVGGVLGGGTAAVAVQQHRPDTAGFATALVIYATAYLLGRTHLLHLACAAAAAGTATSLVVHLPSQDTGALVGLALTGLALVWVGLVLAGVLDEQALGLAVAAVLGFVGGEAMAVGRTSGSWQGYAVLVAVAGACLTGYVFTRHAAVLAVGVVALATVVPQAVADYTNGALGAAGVLLVTGLSIVGASVLGLRLRRTSPEDLLPG